MWAEIWDIEVGGVGRNRDHKIPHRVDASYTIMLSLLYTMGN